MQKNKIEVTYFSQEGEKKVKKHASLFVFENVVFLVHDSEEEKIQKIIDGKIEESNREELKEFLNKKTEKRITSKLMTTLKKILGDFEIIF